MANNFPKLQNVLAEFQINGPADADDYLALLEQYPDYVRGVRRRFVGQAERGILLPKEAITLVLPMLNHLRQEPEPHPLCLTEDRLTNLNGDKTAYQKRATDAIIQVNEQIGKLIDFIDENYQSRAPDAVGISQYPAGESYYRLLVQQRTTTTLCISCSSSVTAFRK